MLARRRQLTTGALFSLVLFLALLLDRPWTSNNELLQEQNQILDLVNITKVANRIVPGVAIPFDDHGSFLGSTIRVVQHSLDSRTDSPSSEGAEDNSQSQIYQDAVSKGHQLSCLMDCTVKEATKKVENKYQIQSPYANPKAEFEKWGWVAAETKTVDQTFLSQDGLKELLSALHLSTAARDWDLETVQHIRAWKADGKEGPVSLQLHHISILSLTASTGLDRT